VHGEVGTAQVGLGSRSRLADKRDQVGGAEPVPYLTGADTSVGRGEHEPVRLAQVDRDGPDQVPTFSESPPPSVFSGGSKSACEGLARTNKRRRASVADRSGVRPPLPAAGPRAFRSAVIAQRYIPKTQRTPRHKR